jgi:zinc transport system ATP-binding protein
MEEHLPILNFSAISFEYEKNKPILNNINFTLKHSESLGIIGPNGGGKTTLLKLAAGILKPTSGHIFINGEDQANFNSPYPCSYVPQIIQLNNLLPLRIIDYLNLHLISKQTHSIQIKKLLEMVGLDQKEKTLIRELSGGELQRVILAKALLTNPSYIILDEPTTGLDSKGQGQFLSLISFIQKELKIAIIMVDHNINQTIKYCDKILCLNKTFHWHDKKEALTPSIIGSIYHCEFEHLLIHEQLGGLEHHHHECNDFHNTGHAHDHKKDEV